MTRRYVILERKGATWNVPRPLLDNMPAPSQRAGHVPFVTVSDTDVPVGAASQDWIKVALRKACRGHEPNQGTSWLVFDVDQGTVVTVERPPQPSLEYTFEPIGDQELVPTS